MIQPFLPGADLSYKQSLEVAYRVPLERKIANSIALLQTYETMALELSPQGYYLAFSGGKDSVVIKELARLAGVKFEAWYNQTTIDPPELVRFIQDQHAEVRWNRPEMNLVFYGTKHPKGPPTRLNRWCCEVYKEQGGNGKQKIVGVRAAESPRRAVQWREVVANRRTGTIICPILYWTDEDVWTFIRSRNLPYCSLYDEGFKRLGCVGCPVASSKNIARDFARWPGFQRLWKLGVKAYFERWKGVPKKDGGERWLKRFQTWEELWDWWLQVDKKGNDEECQTSLLQV